MRSINEAVKLESEVFPDRTQVIEREKDFIKGLEGSTPTVNEGNRMPTMKILCEVQRNFGLRERTEHDERESMTNKNKSPVEERGRVQKERGEGMVWLP